MTKTALKRVLEILSSWKYTDCLFVYQFRHKRHHWIILLLHDSHHHVLSVSCVAVLSEFDNPFQIFHGGIVQFPASSSCFLGLERPSSVLFLLFVALNFSVALSLTSSALALSIFVLRSRNPRLLCSLPFLINFLYCLDGVEIIVDTWHLRSTQRSRSTKYPLFRQNLS